MAQLATLAVTPTVDLTTFCKRDRVVCPAGDLHDFQEINTVFLKYNAVFVIWLKIDGLRERSFLFINSDPKSTTFTETPCVDLPVTSEAESVHATTFGLDKPQLIFELYLYRSDKRLGIFNFLKA